MGQDFHKTFDSNFEEIRSNVLWGGANVIVY
mgnify:CR=1 FL=1